MGKNISKEEKEFYQEAACDEYLSEDKLKKKRNRKSRLAICCFVLLLAVGALGNWYLDNSDFNSKVSSISSAKEKILGEATFVDATTEKPAENEYFNQARLDRQKARDESLDKLQAVINSSDKDSEAKKIASEKIAKISDLISAENKIETLVTAKGVKNCLAVANEDGTKVDVIIDVEDLDDSTILQVKEIAVAQLGCTFENVTIIQSN